MRIGIDIMGSDCSPLVLYEGVLRSATSFLSSDTLLVFATEKVFERLKQQYPEITSNQHGSSIHFHLVREEISMEDDPLSAVQEKKESSLVTGIRLLNQNHIDSFISAGNTGALLVGSKLMLPMIPGISRPALLASLPTKKGNVSVVDVGGNVSCKADHLVQFACMGAACQQSLYDLQKPPRVGLLNVGIESIKGTLEHREAYKKLTLLSKNSAEGIFPMNFIGNVEGREVFEGKVDVLVTDGFSGNILLKTAEGIADYIFDSIYETFKDLLTDPIRGRIEAFQQKFNYAEYPGAILCGVDRIVIKCHGESSSENIQKAIFEAKKLVENRFLERLRESLSQ